MCHSQFQVFGNVNNRSNEQQSAAAGYGHKVLQQLSIPGDELTVGGGEKGNPNPPEKRKQTGKAKEAVAVATEE